VRSNLPFAIFRTPENQRTVPVDGLRSPPGKLLDGHWQPSCPAEDRLEIRA
jgi:hypothetical protein